MMDLPFVGQRIVGHESGYTTAIELSGGFEVRIESRMRLRVRGAEHDVEPGADAADGLLDALAGGEVTLAAADAEGALRIELRDGSRVLALPDPQFEAWTVAGPGGFKVVCGPGGGLTLWSAAG
ncbi:DUF6188 family protein [Nucisporomicrobium flavum]|uniref:DUF6188 family protein n=1 Tax=Nucisporomicrobium flavum TaxID=2785915 RepID=UPI003C2EC4F2